MSLLRLPYVCCGDCVLWWGSTVWVHKGRIHIIVYGVTLLLLDDAVPLWSYGQFLRASFVSLWLKGVPCRILCLLSFLQLLLFWGTSVTGFTSFYYLGVVDSLCYPEHSIHISNLCLEMRLIFLCVNYCSFRVPGFSLRMTLVKENNNFVLILGV